MENTFWRDIRNIGLALAGLILLVFIIYKIVEKDKGRIIALPSKTYYVAVNGNDNNSGTFTSPFATWQKGFSTVTAGDTLYIRGGTYKPVGTNTNNVYLGYVGAYINGKSGTAANPIVVRSYKNEVPILDCINMRQTSVHIGVCLFNVNYWKLYGLTVMNAKQMPGQKSSPGFLGYNMNYSVFERLVGHDNGGSGIAIKWESDENWIKNCDGYNNVDQYTGGDDADGIEVSFIQYRAGNPRKNYIVGCRGWHNSDDGFDFYSGDGILVIENNWAWRNGAYMGIGSGIKVGSSNRTEYANAGIVQRIVKNNISAYNDAYGFATNNLKGIVLWENNISFHNVSPSTSYVSYGYERWHNNYKSTFLNNVSLEDQNTISGLGTGKGPSIETGNSWQSGFAVTRSSFISVDTTELKWPRKANGDLPDILAFKRKGFVPPPVDPPVDTVIVPPIVPPIRDTIFIHDTVFIDPIDTVFLKVRKGTKVVID